LTDFDGVIFDMDGTLVEPLLDFAAIRAELGVAAEQGILEAIAAMPADRAAECNRLLLAHEVSAARQARLLGGAAETLTALRAAGLKTALLTRNSGEALAIVLRRFALPLDLAWSREHGPIKPQPDGVLRACRLLKLAPARTACVGDFRYDLQAANAAGAVSVLLARGVRPAFAHLARHVIAELSELPGVLGIAAEPAVQTPPRGK